jgi:hypothetical protein
MTRFITGLLALAVAAPAMAAEVGLGEGHWRLAQKPSATAEFVVFLLKVEKKDGKLVAEVADAPNKSIAKLDSFKSEGNKVVVVVAMGANKLTFEGTIDAKDANKDAKIVRGSYGDDRRAVRGVLILQDKEKLPTAVEITQAQPKAPEPMLAAQKLSNAPFTLQFQAQRTNDANEKAELLAKAKEARKEADEKVPGLYRQVVEKHADSPYAIDAATQLLRGAAKAKASAEDVAKWVKLIDKDAATYGDRLARETALANAELLVGQKGYELIALAEATTGSGGMTEKSPLAVQSRILKTLKAAQAGAGKDQDARATDTRLVKVEAALDAEYVKTVPPFKPEKFAGRKDKEANRVAVMELFTGATCPPCVAADVAFDALEASYESKDLVLIQYHMHIPGPDTLTNPDTVARWDYYRAKLPENMRGVPSALFNGKPFEKLDTDQTHGGGGPMANSENKFKQYRAVIDPLLESASDVKLTGTAKRSGDKISAVVGVEVKEPGENIQLRVLLIEEKVKYAGSNGIRFHHQVVRALPGGPAGTTITGNGLKKSVDVDLAEIRKGLTKYLDDFAADRPFPNPDRPMEFSHLKIIALVQNDMTAEILNAAEFPVEGK